jgi:hypothetical protein
MSRKPLSPEATEALHDVMRKACERMERRDAESYGVGPCMIVDLPLVRAENERVRLVLVANDQDAERLAADVMADFLGANA